jgi:hypothetical protein
MLSVVPHGVSQDQIMARHKANYINVVYAPSAKSCDKTLFVKVAMLNELGIEGHFCGDVHISNNIHEVI